MQTNETFYLGGPTPSMEMEYREVTNGDNSPINWGKLLKILIAVLTALAGSIGLASCAS